MSYTRKQLEQLSSEFKAKPVLNELLQKVTDNKLISLAEEDYVCAMMRIIRQGPGAGVPVYDVATIPACDNYRFRRTYLLYAHDLRGDSVSDKVNLSPFTLCLFTGPGILPGPGIYRKACAHV